MHSYQRVPSPPLPSPHIRAPSSYTWPCIYTSTSTPYYHHTAANPDPPSLTRKLHVQPNPVPQNYNQAHHTHNIQHPTHPTMGYFPLMSYPCSNRVTACSNRMSSSPKHKQTLPCQRSGIHHPAPVAIRRHPKHTALIPGAFSTTSKPSYPRTLLLHMALHIPTHIHSTLP